MATDDVSPTDAAAPSVAMRLVLERESLLADATVDTHVIIELEPRGAGVERARPVLSVVFALDISGSMKGPPIEHVKSSVIKLVGLLGDSARAGVVGFADDAVEVAEVRSLDSAWKRIIDSRVQRLRAGGGTNMGAGLRLAHKLLGERAKHERQLIVLLSDGQPNRGVADLDGLRAIVTGMRPDVATVTMGYGPHHNEDLLAPMADVGNGEYFYVADPLQADDAFARAVGAQGDVVAEAVEVTLSPDDGLDIGGFIPAAMTRVGRRGLVVSHADLFAGRTRYLIVRVKVKTPAEPSAWPALDVELRYRQAGTEQIVTSRDTLTVPVGLIEGALVPEAHMRVLLARAEIARAEARALADRGQFDGAAAVIHKLIEELEKAPGFSPGDGSVLADALEQLVDERMAYQRRPSAESYRDFKRMAMGVYMQDGGWHHSEEPMQSAGSSNLAADMAGSLPPAHLLVSLDDKGPARRVDLDADVGIGRTRGNRIMLPIGGASKRHARIVGRRGNYLLVDLRSTNGTYVNGQKVDAPRELTDGDEITIGEAHLRFCLEPVAKSDA